MLWKIDCAFWRIFHLNIYLERLKLVQRLQFITSNDIILDGKMLSQSEIKSGIFCVINLIIVDFQTFKHS